MAHDLHVHRFLWHPLPRRFVTRPPNSRLPTSLMPVLSLPSLSPVSEADQFLPGAPGPAYTLPTTMYKTSRPLPRNLLPADYYSARKGHPHLALVIMLVLTQMSVGAFAIDQWLLSMPSMNQALHEAVRPVHRVAALLLGMLGMGAAVFHLGRPHLAYRALLGLKTSWLSREILTFTLFAVLTTFYSACGITPWMGDSLPGLARLVPHASYFLGCLATVMGMVAIGCSVMIYVDTRRPFWNAFQTSVKFFLTALVLGIPTVLLISTIATLWVGNGTARPWADRLAVVLMHYRQTNQLTLAHFDPYSKQPSYKDCAVRIRPAASEVAG